MRAEILTPRLNVTDGPIFVSVVKLSNDTCTVRV